jgi:hypothetical protein
MRTTVAIDDDVLAAARELAVKERKSLGAVLSSLARQALMPHKAGGKKRNGIPLLPTRSGASPITLELVNQLRDELP